MTSKMTSKIVVTEATMTPQGSGEGRRKFSALVRQYKRLGWKEEHHFTGEYVLLIDSRKDKVRIYENGDVWRSNPFTGEYERSTATEGS